MKRPKKSGGFQSGLILPKRSKRLLQISSLVRVPCVAVYGTDYGITAMYGMGATIATRLKEFDAERHGFRVIGIIDLKHNAFEQIPSRIETLVQKEVKTMFRNNKPDKLRIIDTRTG